MKLEIGVLIPKKKYLHFSDYETGDRALMPKKNKCIFMKMKLEIGGLMP